MLAKDDCGIDDSHHLPILQMQEKIPDILQSIVAVAATSRP